MTVSITDAFTGVSQALELPLPDLEAVSDLYVSPGWIDIQVNGYAGFDINAANATVDDLRGMAQALRRTGVTRFLPTIITESHEHIRRCLQVVAKAYQESDLQPMIAGIHLEGPYISPHDGARGAHPKAHVRPPDWQEFQSWQQDAKGLIRIVTLSPEYPEAPEFIERASAAGIIVAIGHTLATSEQIAEAVEAGAKLSTHLGNGIPAMLHRHVNPIWDQLAHDQLYASFIFDGHHLPESVMKVMLRAKGVARTILVSDAVALAGMAPGVYDTPVGGKVELHADGRLTLYGTPYLAGSASCLADGLTHALRCLNGRLADALTLVTFNPARLLNLDLGKCQTIFRYQPGTRRVKPVATVIDGEVASIS